MQDLDFQVVQTAGKIDCNFDELKSALAVQMSAYEDAVVSEDTIVDYKSELATLRKIRKAVDDKRKEIEKEFNKPMDEFKEQVKLLLAEIDKPINLIDTQLKMFEEDRQNAKRVRVTEIYNKQVGEYSDFLPIEKNFNEKWLNKSTTDKDIINDISALVTRIKSDLAVIEGLKSEIQDELIITYKNSGNDLTKAVARNNQYLEDKERVAKTEAEAKAKAEKVAEDTQNSLEKVAEELKNGSENMESLSTLNSLDEIIERTKTVKLIIFADDLMQVKELLDFSNIKYRVEGE